MTRCDVIIVGGGLVGTAAAIALSNAGLDVALVAHRRMTSASASHSSSAVPFDNRVFALRQGAKRFLSEIGVWSKVDQKRIEQVVRMHIDLFKDNSLIFDAYDAGVTELATIVENRNLEESLESRFNAGTSFKCIAANVVSVSQNEGYVKIDSTAGVVTGKLLIAADGSNSSIRRLCNFDTSEHDYGCHGIVGNFEVDKAHHGTAYQSFGSGDTLAFLPLPGRRVSMVWTAPNELKNRGAEDKIMSLVKSRFDPLGIKELITPIKTFPLYRRNPQSIVFGRVVLVGDAAHQFLPIAGQGLNLGFADIEEFLEVSKGYNKGDVGAASILARYRRTRKEEVASFSLLTHWAHTICAKDSSSVHKMQEIVMKAINKSARLKKLFIDYAVG